MKYQMILLFGAPGSGKGTQGKILGAIPGFYHCSTGDIFRSLDLQSEMGRVVWEYSSRGELVPDEFTMQLWKNYMAGMVMTHQFFPETQFVVLDGLPRNLRQAELLDDVAEVAKVIHLRCGDLNKMVERLRRRALKENRIDDANDKVIRNRMEVYERETRPVLDRYPQEKVAKVDATMSQLGVLSEIITIIRPAKESWDRAREQAEAERMAEHAARHSV